ncbi:15271_t:CDS:2 [Cetraspora pellucida]|uniref:15271_t:CDS:1 n=1 Tax=Cetraspora pellucida TaxID=1433469 RepID=A0ACA9K6U2_9GLOM|nr:15271_t:CDS:2 [Cetraspora pellucida]
MYFDIEINKLSNSTEKTILQNLQKKVYQDNEKDQYFINKDHELFKTLCKIDNVNEFTNKIIKKNYLYKLIKDIFEEDVNNVEKFSKLVDLNDNERTLFKKIRPYIHDYKILDKINNIIEKDDSDVSDEKCVKQNEPRKMKTIFNNIIVPNARPFYMRGTRQVIELTIDINEILKVYKNVILTTDNEISYLKSLLLNNIIKYPYPLYFTLYNYKTERDDNFFINARSITQQHFLDIKIAELESNQQSNEQTKNKLEIQNNELNDVLEKLKVKNTELNEALAELESNQLNERTKIELNKELEKLKVKNGELDEALKLDTLRYFLFYLFNFLSIFHELYKQIITTFISILLFYLITTYFSDLEMICMIL